MIKYPIPVTVEEHKALIEWFGKVSKRSNGVE